ncbi:MAG: helix-turn-helix domain-containing protein [Clostridia bacterium]|nr:helix-turn-helix domain-containing protein [Clostridia bacterium]
MVKDENYIVMHGWMRNKLGLKGNDLIVYAVLWGFSQDGESEFRGTIDYITDFSGSTRITVIRSLQSLVKVGFIKKVERNIKEGKANGYICVPLDQIGVYQNDTRGCIKMLYPPYQNDTRGVSKCYTPQTLEEKEINKESDKEIIKKESKKEGIKEDKDKFKKQTYDEILDGFDFSDDTVLAVRSLLKSASLNKRLLTNDDLKRFLEALKTYSDEERPTVVYKAIDTGSYMIKPKSELHFDEMGIESALANQDFDDIINSSIFSFSDVVKREIWHFIAYRKGIKAPLTNEGLHRLCLTLRFSFLTGDDEGRIKILIEAIQGGYRWIKEPPPIIYRDIEEVCPDLEEKYG